MFHHPRVIRRSALVALLAAVMFWSGDRALAIQGSEGKVLFGPIARCAKPRLFASTSTASATRTMSRGSSSCESSTGAVSSPASGDYDSLPASPAPLRSTSAIRTSSPSNDWDAEPCARRSWASTRSPTRQACSSRRSKSTASRPGPRASCWRVTCSATDSSGACGHQYPAWRFQHDRRCGKPRTPKSVGSPS